MKEDWKPGTMIYPLPAVLVSCGSTPEEYNILTVAWREKHTKYQYITNQFIFSASASNYLIINELN